jgi:regulatory protein
MSSSAAYVDALKMLARRELSEAQVRQRLIRRGHDEQAIDEAVFRLKEERAIDDSRVAEAIARTQSISKGRGRLRVEREIEAAGIRRSNVKAVIDSIVTDEDALVEAAVAKRLRGRAHIADDAEFRRLYRYLVGQGFEHDRIMRALTPRTRR